MPTENSTIGRTNAGWAALQAETRPAPGRSSVQLLAVRAGLRALSLLAPGVAARLVSRFWFTPPRLRVTEAQRAALAQGARLQVTLHGRRVAAWSFGDGPVVLLVHGWGGHAGQLLPLVPALVESGLRAVLFDGLAHGQSEASPLGRRQGSFVDLAGCVVALRELLGEPHAIIAHSGGAAATGVALGGGRVHPKRLVLLAPFARPLLFAQQFDRMLGLSPEVAERWRADGERRVGFSWPALDLTTGASRFPVPRTLIVHDREDREVPFAEGEALREAWPEARLLATAGLGHKRILRDPEVVRGVALFVREE